MMGKLKRESIHKVLRRKMRSKFKPFDDHS